jgi:hypothetical protein
MNVPTPTPGSVTWIRVDKPAFDIIGLVLGSIAATAVLAAGALLLGVALGLLLIRRRSRRRTRNGSHLTRLDLPGPFHSD